MATTPTIPKTDWLRSLTSLENLVARHPNDPGFAVVKAVIAQFAKDKLTVEEAAQLDKTVKALEGKR